VIEAFSLFVLLVKLLLLLLVGEIVLDLAGVVEEAVVGLLDTFEVIFSISSLKAS
jgi:hypothetical protein